MRSQEFLDVAVLLLEGTGPHVQGRRKSSISRSYYAAYLGARDRLLATSYPLDSKRSHDQVWKAFKWGDDEHLKTTGKILQDLKRMRETADYEIDRETEHALANDARDMSQQVLAALPSLNLKLVYREHR